MLDDDESGDVNVVVAAAEVALTGDWGRLSGDND